MSNTILVRNESLKDWLENYECLGTWDDDDKAYFENEADFNASFSAEIQYTDKHDYIF